MSMIPADLASRLRLLSESTVQPLASTSEISDKLADLVPGQRLTAEIQALLPNGAYRAIVGQRELVLALPFSAKSGDSLDLQVVENDGKLALALLTKGSETGTGTGVTATLSQTGKLISSLLGDQTAPTPGKGAILNGGFPILAAPPSDATATPQLAHALQQAVTTSGLFYESHQAKWVSGQLPREALLVEPQGQLSQLSAPTAQSHSTLNDGLSPAAMKVVADAPAAASPATSASPSAAAPSSLPAVAPETAPLVQQQLTALANQVVAWQGQVWPGQDMRWEISEEERRRGVGASEEAPRWQTSLHLQLPALGDIDAVLRLQGNSLTLQMTAPAYTSARLQSASPALHQALADAGVTLTAVDIRRHEQS